jgi:pimeloyl-ACP methyl ester carboxylesterase
MRLGGIRLAVDDCFMVFHGLKVHVKVVEPEDALKHRVFLLSSPLTSAFNWRKITPELSQLGCFTAILDLPGFGESACGAGVPQNARLHARIAWGVLDELDHAIGDALSSWHLVGHGDACRTITCMGNAQPDSVRSQVLIAPNLGGIDALRPQNTPRARWFDESIRSADGFRQLMDRLFARPADDYILDMMRRPFLREGAKTSFLKMLAQETAPVAARGFSPVMALWGERDILMDARARGAVKQFAPEAETHLFKTAGHIPMETHSRALRDYLRGWLRYVG